MRPETRYAKKDEWYVGYQVFGSGSLDILFITNWSTNLDAMWDEPTLARFLERLASIGRVICYDRRGTGVSDPMPLAALPTLEDWMDDALAVLDAVGVERAAVIGDTEGGPMAMMLAASHPERVTALVLVNTFARMVRDDDYRFGLHAWMVPGYLEAYEASWGNAGVLQLTAPSVGRDPAFLERYARYQRLCMAPRASTLMYTWVLGIDVRSILPNIQAPTVVLHRQRNRHYRLAYGRYLAEHIGGASLVELPGGDCYPFHAGDSGPVLDEIQAFLTGVREVPWQDRVLATVLFTDIVSSTELAIELGDRRWLDLREAHHSVVRQHLERHHGTEVETTGDGFLATFDGPARAIRCAVAIA